MGKYTAMIFVLCMFCDYGCSSSPHIVYSDYYEHQKYYRDVLILLDITVDGNDNDVEPGSKLENILIHGAELLEYADMVLRLKGYTSRIKSVASVNAINGLGQQGDTLNSDNSRPFFINPAFSFSDEMQTTLLRTIQSVHMRRKSARTPRYFIPEARMLGDATGAGAIIVLHISAWNIRRTTQTVHSVLGDMLFDKTGIDIGYAPLSGIRCAVAVVEMRYGEVIWNDSEKIERDSFGPLSDFDLQHAIERVLGRLPQKYY